MWSGIKDFSEGYVDAVADHLLPDNATPDCQNVLAPATGILRKRAGQQRYGGSFGDHAVRGMHAYYYGANRRLVVASGDRVLHKDPMTGNYLSIRTGLSTTALTCFTTTVHFLVAFNGVNPPWKWDGTTATLLANAPVDGQFAVLYKEKLFTVPLSTPSTLRWADSFQPELWPLVNFWDVGLGDGDAITNVIEHQGDLIILKHRSIHTLSGTGLSDFRMRNVHSSLGCVGPFAAVVAEPDLYFVSNDGLCVWNGMSVVNLSTQKIPALWSRINRAHIHKAVVGVWDDYVWFALPEGISTYNNLVVACKIHGKDVKFWPWRGINASCMQRFDDGNGLQFYTGDAISGWINRQYLGSEDFGQPVNAYWRGKAYAMDQPEYKKKFKEMRIIDSPNAPDVVLDASIDYAPHQFLRPISGDTLVRRFLFPQGTYGRYVSPRIVHSVPGNMEVRGLTVLYQQKMRMN